MKILGLSTAKEHDPAAALLIDGKIVAAAEEERFNRIKHAYAHQPILAAKFCLKQAGLTINDIDVVALARSCDLAEKLKWDYAKKMCFDYPGFAWATLRRTSRYNREAVRDTKRLIEDLGGDPAKVKLYEVEHHLTHLSSAYHLSGFDNAAVMSIDGRGEFTTAILAEGKDGKILKLKEITLPDSLGYFYSLVTRHLGFRMNNGEFKVMGMSPYGDPAKADLSDLLTFGNGEFTLNKKYIWPIESLRRHKLYRKSGKAKDLEDILGPQREGDGLSEPYIHIAAAAQKMLEDAVMDLVKVHLGDVLKRTGGKLCFAGGTALNVRLNRKLLYMDEVNALFVQPAAHDAGIPLGAATYAAMELGDKVEPMQHAYLGPEYSDEEIKEVLDRFRLPYEYHEDIEEVTAGILAKGKIVSWLQGRMEYGPRALGNRSILANPATPGIADEVNGRIKFRENWRPFCPSVLAERAPEMINTDHGSDYMTFSFIVDEQWAEKVPEIVHVDGSARPQTVRKETNPRFHKLISEFDKLTGLPIVLNTSLNRRGEPMVCSPEDAVCMFYQCGLEYLVMGNYLVRKSPEQA